MNDQTDRGSDIEQGRAAAGGCPLCHRPLPEGTMGEPTTGSEADLTLCLHCHSLIPPTAVDDDPDLFDAIGGEPGRAPQAGSTPAPDLAWHLAEFLPPPNEAAVVVELGAGRGDLLNAFAELGYRARGCEPSSFLCQMARASYLLGPDILHNTGLDQYLDLLEAEAEIQTPAGGGPPSAVVLWHVLDRQPDPVGLLRRCLGLAEGGRLFVGFPVPRTGLTLPEQRFAATPRTLLHLADEVGAAIVSATVGHGDLGAVLAAPKNGVVDLDRPTRHQIDLDALERAYRTASPVFASVDPEPAATTEPVS